MCRLSYRVWHFDPASGQCLEFLYGGCGGNGNRYLSKWHCEKNCIKSNAIKFNSLNHFGLTGIQMHSGFRITISMFLKIDLLIESFFFLLI